MSTFAERRAIMYEVLTDPDFVITSREKLTYIYHWYSYEVALSRRAKADRQVKKYGPLVEQDTEAFRLRKKLTKV